MGRRRQLFFGKSERIMTKKELYEILKERFEQVLKEHQIENDHLSVSCRALTPGEAIGKTKRTDYPILTGKDVMIQAEYKECWKIFCRWILNIILMTEAFLLQP